MSPEMFKPIKGYLLVDLYDGIDGNKSKRLEIIGKE